MSDVDGAWLAGLCCGEACFRMSMKVKNTNPNFSAQFQVHLRADYIGALIEIKRIWNIDIPILLWDRVKDRNRGIDAGDGAKLIIRDIPILWHKVVPTFEKYSMRGKKQNEISVFSRGVKILYDKRSSGRRRARFTESELCELEKTYWELREIKKYTGDIREFVLRYPATMLP